MAMARLIFNYSCIPYVQEEPSDHVLLWADLEL